MRWARALAVEPVPQLAGPSVELLTPTAGLGDALAAAGLTTVPLAEPGLSSTPVEE